MRSLVAACLLWLVAACAAPGEITGLVGPSRLFLPADEARAQIIAVHGFNDHSAAFTEFGAFAESHGYIVEAYDQPGFGRSADWGYWPGREALIAALRAKVEERRIRRPDLPLYLMGESMGAAVVIATLANDSKLQVDGVILVAPAVWAGDAMSPLYRLVLRLAATFFPGWHLTGEGLHIQASDNIEMLRALSRDPLFIKSTRVDAIAGLVGLMEEAREDGPKLHGPRLVLAGARDEVVPPEALSSFIATLPSQGCTAIDYPDGWHMLLRDLERERVWQDILAWLGGATPKDSEACGQTGQPPGS